ncbi:MAG TPA: DUF6186 family protein [Actinophytocola sp.]|uniref:DUF6186 family protein n=1 Tax=Actinophytocola sp. TaxID=1872138 RepID=UPI002DDD5ADC|nr:DUF6186 family protein [Actinophytocola sp.]HEV2780816.1 DUF6186 family protein [Actinophytocola sp.]
MTDRTIIILGFAALALLILAAVVASHLRRDRLATISETVAHLTRTRSAKIIAVLIWAWLGWHFLAR